MCRHREFLLGTERERLHALQALSGLRIYSGMSRLRPVQVFVANPNKTEKITELLQHNKDKLLRYLGDFHTDKGALTCFTIPTAG